MSDFGYLDYFYQGIPDDMNTKGSNGNIINISGKPYLKAHARAVWAIRGVWAPAVAEQFKLFMGIIEGDDLNPEVAHKLGMPFDVLVGFHNNRAELAKLIACRMGYKIDTQLVKDVYDSDPKLSRAVIKATITDPFGNTVSAHGSETQAGFPKGHLEKAETKAIGRALFLLGFGTEWTDAAAEFFEGEHVVDSPVDEAEKAATERVVTESKPKTAVTKPAQTTTTTTTPKTEPARQPSTPPTISSDKQALTEEAKTYFKSLKAERGETFIQYLFKQLNVKNAAELTMFHFQLVKQGIADYVKTWEEGDWQGKKTAEPAPIVPATPKRTPEEAKKHMKTLVQRNGGKDAPGVNKHMAEIAEQFGLSLPISPADMSPEAIEAFIEKLEKLGAAAA